MAEGAPAPVSEELVEAGEEMAISGLPGATALPEEEPQPPLR